MSEADDSQLASFAEAFHRLADWVDHQPPPHIRGEDAGGACIGERLEAFLGPPHALSAIEVVKFRLRDLPHVQMTMDDLMARDGRKAELMGWLQGELDYSGIGTVMRTTRYGRVFEGPPRFRTVELADSELQCLTAGLYLVEQASGRWAASVNARDEYGNADVQVEVVAGERALVEEVAQELRRSVRGMNVYRGATISLDDHHNKIAFHRVEHPLREEIILPEEVIEAIERNAIEFARSAEQLRAAGRHVRRGLLFHGPPGTGKSMTVRYVIGQMPERTTVLVSGEGMGAIKETCELARALEPATVVIEDVDLIARSRKHEDANYPALFSLMNEMDGISPDADVLFILTTNRPEVLEPALAARPGRIDQAIAFPLPDDDCRRRLFHRYGEGLSLQADDLDEMVRRTVGASPAFIRELLRKAVLFAIARSAGDEAVSPTRADLDEALHEMVVVGGDLTAKLLGGAPRKAGFVPPALA